MGACEVGRFLEAVAQTEKDPVRALAESRDAVDFLYREVLHLQLGEQHFRVRLSTKDTKGHEEWPMGSETHRGRSDAGPVFQLIFSSCYFVSFVDNRAWPGRGDNR